MHNKSALVVDDSRVARMTLSKFLKSQGFDITEQGSGEDALAWLASTENKPDIIFMDVMMEGMDGLTTTREIKAQPQLGHIPVIICSGNESDADLSKAMETGAEAVLSKPPAAEAVEAILKQVEAKLSASQPAVTEVPVAPSAEPSIVAIDEAALVSKVFELFRQQSLPELHQQVRDMAEDISRQIAHDVAQEASDSRSQSLIPQLTQQVTESAKETIQSVRQNLDKHISDVIERTAGNALNQAMQDYGLTEKLMVTLRSEGTSWLKKQEQPIREGLQKQLQDNLAAMVNRYLDEQLPERVNSLVKVRVEDSLAEAAVSLDEQLSAAKQQAALSLKVAVGAIIVAVAAIALNFI